MRCRSVIRTVMVLVAALGFGEAAHATPIPVGAANELVINFDFSGNSPPPPYPAVGAMLDFTGWSGETIVIDLFQGLNGTGGPPPPFINPVVQATGNGAFLSFLIQGAPTLSDGQFSIGLYLLSGDVDLVDAVGQAFTAVNDGTLITTVAGTFGTIPEPGTLALLLLGAAPIVLGRRRHLH